MKLNKAKSKNNIDTTLKFQKIIVCIPALITLLLWWSPIHTLDFVNWDDPTYITANDALKNLRWKDLISLNFAGNYHPITMLSLGLDVTLSGLNPTGFHRTNLLLHVLNTLLIFIFIQGVFKNHVIAFSLSLLFGIHPLHVESVAWISERKDVLYLFFWLLAGIVWQQYKNLRKPALYLLTIILFTLACLSKAMAVTWVPIIFYLEYHRNPTKYLQTLKELIPFTIIAIFIGISAIFAQGDALNTIKIPLGEQLIIANYGFWFYIIQTLFPNSLSAFYPYPESIPLLWYACIALSGICIYALYTFRNRMPIVVWGTIAFVIIILPVLQIIPVGEAMVADRYSYAASVGLFLIPIGILHAVYSIHTSGKQLAIVLFCAWAGMLGWKSRNLIPVWQNSISLYTNVLKLYPNYSTGYVNLGNALRDRNDYAGAEKAYWRAIVANPENDLPWNNLGILNSFRNKPFHSILYYSKAAEKKPDFPVNDYNIATAWFNMGKLTEAKVAIEKSLTIDSLYPEALHLYGVILQQQKLYPASIQTLQKAANVKPYNERIITDMGNSYFFSGDTKNAVQCFEKSIAMQPSNNPEAYNNLAYMYMQMGNQNLAIENYKIAAQQGHAGARSYIEQLNAARN